jgi:hypothetical protein
MTARGEQRRLPASVVELLERFGSEMRCGAADRLFFDKAAIQRLEKHFCDRRSFRHLERWLSLRLQTRIHLTQDNDVDQTFTPDRSDQPFDKAILPGRGWCGGLVPDAAVCRNGTRT